VGYELLPELGGSDTAQKMFLMGAAVPTGFVAPTTTAATIAGNRAFQAGVNRNQSLVNMALDKAQQPKLIEQQKAALRAKKSKP